ncbi:MAG TPA: hypothetical protein VHD90_08450 [Phototrophicaceae bacterium]|nr:hypothetical protein [Phototrophicaceae bacterium]
MRRSSIYIYIAVALMLVLYVFPWLVNPSASLSPNAYDLAEWASLHPLVHAQTPALLTPLLLRLPLACLALLIAFSTQRRNLISALIVIVLAVALLPPELILPTSDPNSQQMQLLAAITLVGGLIGVSGILPRLRAWIAVAVALIGAAAGALGVAQSYALMRGFNLPMQIGMGGVALTIAFVLVAGTLAVSRYQKGQPKLP